MQEIAQVLSFSFFWILIIINPMLEMKILNYKESGQIAESKLAEYNWFAWTARLIYNK